MQTLELLAPAKNLECGIAAIDHGADAVYIGAPRFGARAAAGNSLEDIRQLCEYAHQFGAKVHVTVNTIIYQDEMLDTLKMIQQLDEIGVDALCTWSALRKLFGCMLCFREVFRALCQSWRMCTVLSYEV